MGNRFRLRTALALGVVGISLPLSPAHSASLVLDQNFRAPLFAQPIPTSRTILLPDGKFLKFFNTDTLTDQRTGAITRYLPDATLDTSFSFDRDYYSVWAAASADSGRLIIAASQRVYGSGFSFFTSSSTSEKILRLNADGSIDSSFNTALVGSGPSATVRTIVVQPDGKVLVAGYFDTFAGSPRQKIVRLLADGTVDSSFTPPQFAGGNGIWMKPVVLADGKILIAGDFNSVNGTANLGVARLNADGSLDPGFRAAGFNRGSGIGIPVRGLIVQSDGKIVLGGRFQFATTPVTRAPLFRLNADGSADTGYVYVTNLPNFPTAKDLVMQPDGKVVGPIGSSLYRFNPNGSLDSSFRQPVLLDTTFDLAGFSGTPFTVNLQSDGRILFGGSFTDVDPSGVPDGSHFGAARLNPDGSLDSTLVTTHKTGLGVFPSSFARLPDGSTLVAFGLQYERIDPAIAFDLARLLPDGSRDLNFGLSSSNPDSVLTRRDFLAEDLTQLADGRFLIFGHGNNLGELSFGGAAFLSSGVEDLAFMLDQGLFGIGKAIALRDGKILVSAGGTDAQTTVDGVLRRLRSYGQRDFAFQLDPSIEAGAVIRDFSGSLIEMYVGSRVLAVQPDGRILFIYYSSDNLFHFVRLNPDGSFDNTFTGTTLPPFDLIQDFPVVVDPLYGYRLQPPGGAWTATPPLFDAQIMPDGRIVIAGRFTSFNGAPARGLVRLESNGTVDPSFPIGGGAQWVQTVETASFFPFVESVKAQVDGKLLIAGTFEAFNGTPLPGIASLNADGTLDTAFTPVAQRQKFAPGTAQLERQADGSFLLSGPYSFPNETNSALLHINSIGGIPVVGSPTIATALPGQPFSYQIVASGQPTSYGASGLPAGFNFNSATGAITGTPTAANIGTYNVLLGATNGEGTRAPRGLTLTIPAALQATAAVSRKTHGSAGDFDIDLPLTGAPGVECRSLGVGAGHLLVFTFNNELLAGSATLTSGVGATDTLFFDGNTALLTVYNAPDQQQITITLTGVTDKFSQVLLDTTVSVNFLLGDTTGNKTVNASDVGQTKSQSGMPVTRANFRGDINASGAINASDIGQIKANAGHTLP